MAKPIELTKQEQAQTLRWFAKTIGHLSITNGVEPLPSAAVQEAMLAGAAALEEQVDVPQKPSHAKRTGEQ